MPGDFKLKIKKKLVLYSLCVLKILSQFRTPLKDSHSCVEHGSFTCILKNILLNCLGLS